MKLSGLHFLISYQCSNECDHCFAWGSPRQKGTMSFEQIRKLLEEAKAMGTVESIYFEGGEPFLFYPILVKSVLLAKEMGFSVGAVSNAYWATTLDDAQAWLSPMAGALDDLSISSDLFHLAPKDRYRVENAEQAAKRLGIPLATISIADPEQAEGRKGMLPEGESAVMFRGRAVETLAPAAPKRAWNEFTTCPHENLRDPGRLHVDVLGNLHICQGLSAGNATERSLADVCENFRPEEDPVLGPLLSGGPAELARSLDFDMQKEYADACHLCYETRRAMQHRFPQTLAPPAMYGDMSWE
jgi:hypothetical protein